MSSGTERVERKLAAIFCADVADYSRLMHLDEVQTLHSLTAHRVIMDGLIAEHDGRIANTAGDSVLAEFPSVVDAVECAVAVQEKLREANAGVPDEKALRFRIGVHVGDVMVRGGDLLGDGVNVAARVQALADPGGVWISSRAFEEIEGKLGLAFEDKGEQQVKNIARPVRVYALAGAAPSGSEVKGLPLPDKPSIAVLPFTNMSGDPEQEYFCDGLTEDIITALSRFKALFVIARNSTFTYKGVAIDVRQVGRDLGVRYVLEGSVRRAGHRVRITGQLIESATGTHIWSERYDGNLDDVFALQDEITANVVAAVEPTVTAKEVERAKQKRTDNLSAYDLYLRAVAELYTYRADTFSRAEELLRRATAQDPDYADALAALADCLARSALNGWRDYAAAVNEASEFAHRAVMAEPDNGMALAVAAWLAYLQGRHSEGRDLVHKALRSHPNSSTVLEVCGWVLLFEGEVSVALEQFMTAHRLNPIGPRIRVPSTGIGAAHFFAKRFEDAAEWCRRALQRTPGHNIALRYLAASLAHLGRISEARTVVERLLASQPTSSLSRSRLSPFQQKWMLDLYIDGLRLAGLPE